MAGPELIADYACQTGEGCLWHPLEKRLYWLDIPRGRMFRYDPASGEHEMCHEEGPVGGITIQADGEILLFGDKGSVCLWREGRVTTLIAEIPGEAGCRFNDVIADHAGRVFCGTMPYDREHTGRLYRLDTDRALTKLLDGIGCSNGMGFTPDRSKMYYTDSRKELVYAFDYEADTGAITNQRVFINATEEEGCPDGMTVDAEGFVWTAMWGGGCVIRWTPEGKEDRRIGFPAPKVSCVTFGGRDFSDMYVTTAGGHQKDENGPAAGALFRAHAGVNGVQEFMSNINSNTNA